MTGHYTTINTTGSPTRVTDAEAATGPVLGGDRNLTAASTRVDTPTGTSVVLATSTHPASIHTSGLPTAPSGLVIDSTLCIATPAIIVARPRSIMRGMRESFNDTIILMPLTATPVSNTSDTSGSTPTTVIATSVAVAITTLPHTATRRGRQRRRAARRQHRHTT